MLPAVVYPQPLLGLPAHPRLNDGGQSLGDLLDVTLRILARLPLQRVHHLAQVAAVAETADESRDQTRAGAPGQDRRRRRGGRGPTEEVNVDFTLRGVLI